MVVFLRPGRNLVSLLLSRRAKAKIWEAKAGQPHLRPQKGERVDTCLSVVTCVTKSVVFGAHNTFGPVSTAVCVQW